jgi:V8-like Glu-specific endopeptidase
MKKLLTFLVVFFLFQNLFLRADEGMWLLNFLQGNMEEMKRLGIELTADQIYSLNNSSLKDAVAALDNGSCTGEVVSPEGLILTNHHCGYSEIQNHSSIEHDYLKNGFWAMSRLEELPNPGKTATFLVRIEDVTDRILPKISKNAKGFQLEREVEKYSRALIADAIQGTSYEAEVKSFFNDNRYFLVVSETYKDIRLVGAPPESIGKFGADTDNWMWPRHTGDFSIFRVYTGPNGEPAEYSPYNVPLKSKKYLPISLKGYKKGDFTLILGFPGSTDRYMTSYEVNELLNIEHPTRIKVRSVKQEIMLADMQSDDKIRIQYASKYSKSTNYWKYSIGQMQGLNNLNVIYRKQELEKQFVKWMNENPERLKKYEKTLDLIEQGINGRKDAELGRQFIFESMYQGMESTTFAYDFLKLYNILSEDPGNSDSIQNLISEIRKDMVNFYKDYNMPTDKKLCKAMLKLVRENVPENFQPDVFQLIKSNYRGSIDKFVEMYFKKSIFPFEDKLKSFLKKPDIFKLEKDPAFIMAVSMINSLRLCYQAAESFDEKIEEGRKLWMAGLMEMEPVINFYPDANSTLRLTYGTVGDYVPRDAVFYSYYTTLEGIMEKEDPDNWEFVVSDKLKDLYRKKDYGRYAEDGKIHVCFTSNNDITGGNSGSPVMNSRGELIGIAFDGNWEAMSGDITYENQLQKCINVDIRYVLFIIDKYAGATHLINEMSIVE